MTRVAVVDYGMGNVASVLRALQECGGDPVLTAEPAELRRAARIVLPGVGAFADGIRNVKARGLDDELVEQATTNGIPLLGLCLGMQLLCTYGEEGGGTAGLNLFNGNVVRLVPESAERVPHVGWNEVHWRRSTPLAAGIDDGADFYFVHGYHVVADDASEVLATTPYCGGIVSVVQCGNVVGAQFHPEKSQRHGLRLLRNFLESRP